MGGDAGRLVLDQRALSRAVNDRVVQVPACFLRPASRVPESADWAATQRGELDLQAWIDDPNRRATNVGFVLTSGWCDIDLDGDDPGFQNSMTAGLKSVGVDSRLKFGRLSKGCASHVLVRLDEDDWTNFASLKRSAPKEFRLAGKRFHADVRSSPPAGDSVGGGTSTRSARLVVAPGSVYPHDDDPAAPDPSVWWADGMPAVSLSDIVTSSPRPAAFRSILRGLAFGLVLFMFRSHWVEGSRHDAARVLTGWLARVVADCAALARNDHLVADVICPIATHADAEAVVSLVCRETGDEDERTRLRAYADACAKLERGTEGRIPGWPALEGLVGAEAALALRGALLPGTEVDKLLTLADRYLFDETDAFYIDRERHAAGETFAFPAAEIALRHKGDSVRIGTRTVSAVTVWEKSDLRQRVGARAFYPGEPPGAILHVTNFGEVLQPDAGDETPALPTFNTWRGWAVTPTANPDPNLLDDCRGKLDRLLGLLTRDNESQMEWIKQWLAWTVQNPGDKQQIAWVVVGGQGVGKSFMGSTFAQALFGHYWGAAAASTVESNFSVSPFLDKLIVFVDEAQFADTNAAETVKKLVRNVEIAGEEKYKASRTYRIYARLMLASNRYSLNFGSATARDRAMFYTKAYDADHLGATEFEFRTWAETLKPFFLEFGALLRRREARAAFMRIFTDMPFDRYAVESVRYSSGGDPDMIERTLSRSRRVAKELIESGYIYEDCAFETPFTVDDLTRRVGPIIKDFGFRGLHAGHVFKELESARMIERVDIGGQRRYRFRHKIATAHAVYSAAIGVPLAPRFVFGPDNEGLNATDTMKHVPWLGARVGAKF